MNISELSQHSGSSLYDQSLAQRSSMVTWKVLRSHLAYFLEHMEVQSKGERGGLRSYSQSDAELRVELGEAWLSPNLLN